MPTEIIFPSDLVVADHPPLVYKPEFWDPRKAYARYRPDLDAAFMEGVAYRQDNRLATAAQLIQSGVSNIAMLVDLEDDFTDFPGAPGRLPVIGTCNAVLRICARLLNGTVQDHYTGLIASQDGHPDGHISFGSRWLLARPGRPPLDLRERKAAMLTLADRKRALFYAQSPTGEELGIVQSMFDEADTVDYWDHLQSTGQGPIWAFATHCMLSSDGVNMNPFLQEVLAFMSGARLILRTWLFKGHLLNTDWFSPLVACRPDPRHPQGTFQKPIVDLFAQAKGVEFFGVAEDFCLYGMERDTMMYFKGTPVFERLAFADDGTAPIVPNAAHVQTLRAEAVSGGVKFFDCAMPFGTFK